MPSPPSPQARQTCTLTTASTVAPTLRDVMPAVRKTPRRVSAQLVAVDAERRPLHAWDASAASIWVHVYDVSAGATATANQMCVALLPQDLFGGIFHVGVEVHGAEWSFGSTSGIGFCMPRAKNGAQYRCSTPLGVTKLTSAGVKELVAEMRDEWPGSSYDVLARNCCNFCNDFALRLGANALPPWVDRFARVGTSVRSLGQSVFSSLAASAWWSEQSAAACRATPLREECILAVIDHSNGCKYGCVMSPHCGGLLITDVQKEGLVARWNAGNPQQISTGDMLLEVNGIRGPQTLLMVLEELTVLRFVLRLAVYKGDVVKQERFRRFCAALDGDAESWPRIGSDGQDMEPAERTAELIEFGQLYRARQQLGSTEEGGAMLCSNASTKVEETSPLQASHPDAPEDMQQQPARTLLRENLGLYHSQLPTHHPGGGDLALVEVATI